MAYGTINVDTLTASTGVLATQNGMTGIAKAWVQYNGSTQTINGSFNVSSVTYTSTGQYTINFTTAMTNTNYCVVASGGNSTNSSIAPTLGNSGYNPSFLTTSVKVAYDNSSGTYINPTFACVAILGS